MRGVCGWLAPALLTVSLSGCSVLHIHRRQPSQAPTLQTGQGAIDKEQAKQHQGPPPSTPPQTVTQPPQLPPVAAPKVKRAKRRKPREVAPPEDKPATDSQPAAPAIGNLTTGNSAAAAKSERATLVLMHTTQQGLANLKRSLNTEQQATVAQIRVFLQQAQQALQNGDTDGAQTLATKAKLMLDELTSK